MVISSNTLTISSPTIDIKGDITAENNTISARIISAGDYVEGSEGYFSSTYTDYLGSNTNSSSITSDASISPRSSNKHNLGNSSQYWKQVFTRALYFDGSIGVGTYQGLAGGTLTTNTTSYLSGQNPSTLRTISTITSNGRSVSSYGNVFVLGVPEQTGADQPLATEYFVIAFGYANIGAGTANTTVRVALPTSMNCFTIVATQNDTGGNNQPQYYNAIKVDSVRPTNSISTFSLYVYPSESLQINYIALGYKNL